MPASSSTDRVQTLRRLAETFGFALAGGLAPGLAGVPAGYLSGSVLAVAAADFWGPGRAERFCVLTGGEPMLQIDDALVDALHAEGFIIAMESNGTLPAHSGIDWVCISPKAGSEVVQRSGQELKLVWPQAGIDPAEVEGWGFANHLLQPLYDPRADENREACISMVMERPRWRLTLQTHKMLGLR